MRELLTLLSRSAIGLVGAALTTTSALAFLTLFSMHLVGFAGGPYIGILAYMIIPAFFVIGLILIPLGIWHRRRRARKEGETLKALVVDFNLPAVRRVGAVVLVLTAINLMVTSTATYKAVEVMDSPSFCGGACHQAMGPEYAAYQRSPHSNVKCTGCHVGSGADWFVKSKLNGASQLISFALDSYERPIPAPVHNLRSANETCASCHWPTRLIGDRLRIRSRFSDDEGSTEKKNVYLLHVGGGQDGEAKGIHWHADPNVSIRYRSDEKRKVIYDVELELPDGTKKLFLPEEGAPAEANLVWRKMDCVDCHNRPTHIYQYPQEVLDAALASGDIDRSLPYIKREGLRVIQLPFASHEEARGGIKAALLDFYGKEYPELARSERNKIEAAAEVLWGAYRQNVFPSMKIGWGSYPNFAYEHVGCFRCHDKKHATEKGEKISGKCSGCHTLITTEDPEPEILELLYP